MLNLQTPREIRRLTSLLIGVLSLSLGACSTLQTAEFKTVPYASTTSDQIFLSWPVDSVRINQKFAPHSNPRHKGLDLGGARGTDIRAAHEGVVVYAGRKFRGYGKMILIERNSEWATLYAHLDSIDVKQGDRVTSGQVIGGMGRTGTATGIHLHFELIRHKRPLDPLDYLQVPSHLVSK